MGVVDCLWTIEILSWGDGAIAEEEKKDGLFDFPSIEKGDNADISSIFDFQLFNLL